MSASNSDGRWLGSLLGSQAPGTPKPGEVDLFKSGILPDPTEPKNAVRRARALIQKSRFREARHLLKPQITTAPAEYQHYVHELLGLCALETGGDWQPLLRKALELFAEAGDQKAQARVRRHIGVGLVGRGDFRRADACLQESSKMFRDMGSEARAAMVECVRGRVRLYSGHISAALKRIDASLQVIAPLSYPRPEGFARMDRARTLAHMGRAREAAMELLAAQRLITPSGDSSDRIRTRLVRAETLLVLGQPGRAAAGLRKLMSETATLEDVASRAFALFLLGRALSEEEPGVARRHLTRARHLYESLTAEYFTTRCDLELTRVERALGLNPASRVKDIRSKPLGEWPLIEAEFKVLCAEDMSDKAKGRELLMDARRFALDAHNRYLARNVDQTMRRLGLRPDPQEKELTPMESQLSGGMVLTGISEVDTQPSATYVPMPDSREGPSVSVAPPSSQRVTRAERARGIERDVPMTPLQTAMTSSNMTRRTMRPD